MLLDDSEELYRMVPNKPQMWKLKENRPSSAVFKDSKGVSVDRRTRERTQELVEKSFFERFNDIKAIIYLTVKKCKEIGVYVKSSPEIDNSYHAIILEAENTVPISNSKARKLAKSSIIYKIYE